MFSSDDFFFEQWTFFHGALRPQKPQGLLGTGFVVVYLDYKYSALITYLIRPFIGQWSLFLPDTSRYIACRLPGLSTVNLSTGRRPLPCWVLYTLSIGPAHAK